MKWLAIKLWNGGVTAPEAASRNAAEQLVGYHFESSAVTEQRILADRLTALIVKQLNRY